MREPAKSCSISGKRTTLTFNPRSNNFDSNSFDQWATEFVGMNDSLEARKGGGAGFFCRVEDYKWIGGNDDLFRPASWEDKDLFIRMQLEGYEFRMIPESVVWHFSARGSHFRDEAKDKFHMKSKRQQEAEQVKKSGQNISKVGRCHKYYLVYKIKGKKIGAMTNVCVLRKFVTTKTCNAIHHVC